MDCRVFIAPLSLSRVLPLALASSSVLACSNVGGAGAGGDALGALGKHIFIPSSFSK
jgi:hypothetical protein